MKINTIFPKISLAPATVTRYPKDDISSPLSTANGGMNVIGKVLAAATRKDEVISRRKHPFRNKDQSNKV